MTKYLVIFCLFVHTVPSKAQGILDTVSNSYLTDSNRLTTMVDILNYRSLVHLPTHKGNDETLIEDTYYFKIIDSAAGNEPGLLMVTYSENLNSRTRTIEGVSDFFFEILNVLNEPSNLVNGIAKHPGVHGCFMFQKSTNQIYIYLLRQPNMDLCRFIVHIGNLTASQREALARDLIQKTTFIN